MSLVLPAKEGVRKLVQYQAVVPVTASGTGPGTCEHLLVPICSQACVNGCRARALALAPRNDIVLDFLTPFFAGDEKERRHLPRWAYPANGKATLDAPSMGDEATLDRGGFDRFLQLLEGADLDLTHSLARDSVLL